MSDNKEVVTSKTSSVSTDDNVINSNSAFTLVRQENGIAHLVMDVVGDTMNTLKAEFTEQVADVLAEIKADAAITGIVLCSGKQDSFVAGADINMINNCQTKEEVVSLSRQGQMIFSQLEQLNIPVVAAINGACLGGGLELAMACHARVCSDNVKTALGVPEVQLGLLPGSGGTQRLPKLVGIQKALDMMLTGKQLRAKQALKLGLVDDVVPNSILIETAEKMALSGKFKRTVKFKSSLINKFLEGTSIGRGIVYKQAEKSVLSKTKGNYPSPMKIIHCVKTGVEESAAKGYQVEAEHFGELAMSPESAQLRNIFFATTEMKKEQGVENVMPSKVLKAGVLGGGLMGGGIAFVTATKANIPARIKDIGHEGISHALKYSYDLLNKKVKRRFMRKSEMQKQMSMITGCTDYSGFKNVDIVVEAVFENLELKQNMVVEIESKTKDSTIFASNTSSLPIGKIAEKAARPENVIGLHYFSPVDKMPLVEIIPHATTSDQTISTTVAFAKKQGKTPIVVKDKAGFYVNRILAPYMNEAAILLLAGEPIDKLDKALVDFGFPVGPMQLLDEVGIDVGAKIGPILEADLGERFAAPPAFSKLLDDGRLGKKANKGFYLYGKQAKKGKKQVDEGIYTLLNLNPAGSLSSNEIVKRCTYLMLNEAARCLDEGIVRNARDGDIGAIFGIGFPPFLGGPLRYIDNIGAQSLVAQLTQWSQQHGERYAPCEALITMAENGTSYY
ncbi:fatty acid oxidation complex subunit alpha FadJ [Colwellia sp. 1_MG-2023]|uniref:fatty acid oxidation complex subunit alpha FadJ n=1 Tax=unclassified Colwellia TaxID=196834 RepID=UPI001C081CEF|nr:MULTISPECIES: fatty acid oxidation complex subunit alpha FadJ [unclassified Colwellia]MBU2925776.1 fatty acid oxidation complex subunit alpha FadJ [Colwellia sp. C2M11]MDO6650998.1 fatty acid oxidation complex subunit alpha FadJ [Colwellia sp. 3_MG-2023]MDO6664033.1 fatty acid oxidation complex subunit alpha FadJ [Colwellia sp. 2_MG-2023]MDO6688384.1 fatty acid oxidation complex subunit alpha FadJ [Colwellia sp. 1_MG-2023]